MRLKSSNKPGPQILGMISARKAERLMVSLVNAQLPEETGGGGDSMPIEEWRRVFEARQARSEGAAALPALETDAGEAEALITRLRAQTEKYWPDLWGWADEAEELGRGRALSILRKIRFYLQQFWALPDLYTRDWYLHRARHYHHSHLIQPQLIEARQEFEAASTADDARTKSTWLNIQTENALDAPPRRTPFEESLFHLQRIADKVRFCPNPECRGIPYFIASKKGQKYCSKSCALPTQRASKRKWWSTHRTGKAATANRKNKRERS